MSNGAVWNTNSASQHGLGHRASEAAGVQSAGVVHEVHKEIKTSDGREDLTLSRTQLVAAILRALGHLELTLGAERCDK